MRVELRVDAVTLAIDTQNMETLARWLIEQFSVIDWQPTTWCTVQVWPRWTPGPDGHGRPDWLADSRIITDRGEVKSPRDVMRLLAQQIERTEELTNG